MSYPNKQAAEDALRESPLEIGSRVFVKGYQYGWGTITRIYNNGSSWWIGVKHDNGRDNGYTMLHFKKYMQPCPKCEELTILVDYLCGKCRFGA